jgi:transaldolase
LRIEVNAGARELIINIIIIIMIIMQDGTTIQISKKNRDELKKIGSMGDDYNTVIEKLIREYRNHEYRLKIDRIAEEAKKHFKEHREEYVSVDDL